MTHVVSKQRSNLGSIYCINLSGDSELSTLRPSSPIENWESNTAVSAVSQRSVIDVCCQCWRRRLLAVLKTWLQWKVRRSGLAVLYHLCPLHQSAGSRALSPWPLWPITGQ